MYIVYLQCAMRRRRGAARFLDNGQERLEAVRYYSNAGDHDVAGDDDDEDADDDVDHNDNADDDDDDDDYVLLQERRKAKKGRYRDKQGFTWRPFTPQVCLDKYRPKFYK